MNRAARRAAARGRQAGAQTFYHGTTGYLADAIRIDGLRPGVDGRFYVTDSLEMAQRYAMWSTALASTAVDHDEFEPSTDVGLEAQRHGGFCAAVATVTLPPGTRARIERGSSAPPLPWETVMAIDGRSYMIDRPIAASHVTPWRLWRVAECDEPGMLGRVKRDSDWIADTFRRDVSVHGDAAPGASSGALDAIPDPGGLVMAAKARSPNADSPWHGTSHWLGVAAAGARLLELECRADPAVLFAFAVLHDSQRTAEGHDPEHGQRAADLVAQLQECRVLRLSDCQAQTLGRALVEHDAGRISDDQTIGACWDADRLTLTRLGMTVDPNLLSTDAGRKLASTPGAVPNPEECDWEWTWFRHLIAPSSYSRW